MQISDLAYFENTREDIRSMLSGKFESCLDIGCDGGRERKVAEGAFRRSEPIERIESTSRKKFSKSWWADILTFGIFREFLGFQYVLFARP